MGPSLISILLTAALLVGICAVLSRRNGTPMLPLVVLFTAMAPVMVAFIAFGPVGLLVIPVWFVLVFPLLLWPSLMATTHYPPPVPVSREVMPPAMLRTTAAVEARGFTTVRCTEQGRRKGRVWAVLLLTDDGRTTATVSGNHQSARVSIHSLVNAERKFATIRDRPILVEDHIVQRLPKAPVDTLIDAHAEAVALCDAIGLRLLSCDAIEAVARADQQRDANLAKLRGRELQAAAGVWRQVFVRRSAHRGPVSDQPMALSHLLAWRDEQLLSPPAG